MVTLRPAGPGDGPVLNQTCFPHYTLDEMRQKLAVSLAQEKAGHGVRLVAEQDGQIVGCGQLLSWHRSAEIADLIVIPSHRNQGIGQALIHALLESARILELPTVEIGVQVENQRALALYKRLGFSYRRTVHLSLDGRRSTITYLEREISDAHPVDHRGNDRG